MHFEADEGEAKPTGWVGHVLIAASVGCAIGAGLLLWSVRGDAVFSDLVLTALAWCF